MSGSGPTVVALFSPLEGAEGADRAAAALAGRDPAPIRAASVSADYAEPRPLSERGRSRA